MSSFRAAAAGRAVHWRYGRGRPDTSKVYFLMVTLDEMSGVPRTVLNVANRLADTHEVEVISLYRRRLEPHFEVDPRITVRYLYDQRLLRADGTRRAAGHKRAREHPAAPRTHAFLDRRPSAFYDDARHLSALSDLLLLRHLPRLEPGVVVSARPTLHGALAWIAPPHLLTVGQEHLSYPARMRGSRTAGLMDTVVHRLDALVPLTEADAEDYRRRFPDASALIRAIPNASPVPRAAAVPPLSSRSIVAVGRLERRKGMHRVIQAFRPLASRFPDWTVQIYGSGHEAARLREQIRKLGLDGRVILHGHTTDVLGALDQGSIFAMGSLYEGFPMSLLEAQSRGLPVVSFDCPRGPAEVIKDGVNGRLIPDGDIAGFTAALAELMSDADRRHSFGAQALQDVEAFGIPAIARRWTELFEETLERRGS
jgi:glycosyltransferase involved in cell wall biosynthesis